MKLLATLDRRDRRLLAITGAMVLSTIVLLVLVHPAEQRDTGVPSVDSTAAHGAKAAYLLLGRLGYRVERSDDPLDAVANSADAHTVLILAEPSRAASEQELAAVRRILARGGRVLAAGFLGAMALPENNLNMQSPAQIIGGVCEAEPVGFSPPASGGKVVLREIRAFWKQDIPAQQVSYACNNGAVVVTYPIDKGTVVWWASATPLENQDIGNGGSLDLLLNSLQLTRKDRIVWDESLHAEPAARWDPANDRIILALIAQLLFAGLLLVLSRGRRSGPLRPLPAAPRASPLEFVRSLGGLYRASGANDVPVTIAYERFRAVLAHRHGIAHAQSAGAATLAAMLTERFDIRSPALKSDLEACEGAATLTHLTGPQALKLVQTLARYQQLVQKQSEPSTATGSHLHGDRETLGPQHEPAAPHERIGERIA